MLVPAGAHVIASAIGSLSGIPPSAKSEFGAEAQMRGAWWLALCAAASPMLADAYLQSDNWVVPEVAPGVIPIRSGQLYEPTVNPFRWTWYAIPLLSIDEDNATVYHNLLVEIDAVDMHTVQGGGNALYWAAFDVMVVNESLPANAQTELKARLMKVTASCAASCAASLLHSQLAAQAGSQS